MAGAVEVSVGGDARAAGDEIAGDFVGVSVEMSNLRPLGDGKSLFRADNAALVTLFRTLGIRSLRAGGGSADNVSATMLGTSDLDNFFAFAKAVDAKVLYTLRYTTDPSEDVDGAKYILEHYGDQLAAFEIGDGPRGPLKEYEEVVKAFAAALKPADGGKGATFCGPNGVLQWAPKEDADFATDMAGTGVVSMIGAPAYFGGMGKKIADPEATVTALLAPAMLAEYQKALDVIGPAAKAAKIPFRLNETASYFGGGAKGISDAHVGALWGLDYEHWWALHGAAGLNFHIGSHLGKPGSAKSSWYAPFWASKKGFACRPLAYAMKAFDIGGRGRVVPVKLAGLQGVNVTAYGVMGADKAVMLTVINKEVGEHPRDVNVKLGVAGYAAVELMRMTADDLASTDTETLGGGRIGEDGVWAGSWTAAPGESVAVPAGSAVVVRMRGE